MLEQRLRILAQLKMDGDRVFPARLGLEGGALAWLELKAFMIV
jgi:hypothetical protein